MRFRAGLRGKKRKKRKQKQKNGSVFRQQKCLGLQLRNDACQVHFHYNIALEVMQLN